MEILTHFTTSQEGNLAYHVTENITLVNQLRNTLAKRHHFDINKLHYMDQIHSNIVQTISNTTNPQTCDAIITNQKNTPLLVMVADCIPILLYDTIKNVIGVAHAGRAGTFGNIAGNTIEKMINEYNCDPQNIHTILGPSIQKCCYEVSKEMANDAQKNFGKKFVDGRYIDLQGINKKQLLECGLQEKNIQVSSTCTKCSNQPYFSYRKDPTCGRFAGLIMMR